MCEKLDEVNSFQKFVSSRTLCSNKILCEILTAGSSSEAGFQPHTASEAMVSLKIYFSTPFSIVSLWALLLCTLKSLCSFGSCILENSAPLRSSPENDYTVEYPEPGLSGKGEQ